MFRSLAIVLAGSVLGMAQDCRQRTAEDFVPMTTSERLANAFDEAVSPAAFLRVGIRAGVDMAANRPSEWSRDARGFGLRAGDAFAQNFMAQLVEQSIAYKLHHDNRYFASGERNIARRMEYALASTVLTRRENGSRTFAYESVGGAAAAAFVATAWQPRSTTTAADAAVSFGLTMGVRAGWNLVREFTPRVRRIFPR